jgi:hypothetical protein
LIIAWCPDKRAVNSSQDSSHGTESSASGHPATHHVNRLAVSTDMTRQPDETADQRTYSRTNSGSCGGKEECFPTGSPQPHNINVNP